ncbi:hypothetical protein [Nocardioides insulae]|uniref:hypothetical protein n=1 Tax=Nocardioides insulae TaxID=394734 RepID=UPI000491EFD3|nr:hypothetical protein [Nocardioides insulae]
MSVMEETQSRGERLFIYAVVGIAVVVLVIVGLVTFRGVGDARTADAKADELIAAFEDAGLTAPDKDRVVNLLGDDGGAVCASPNEALNKATFLAQLANGASGPGARPVVVDRLVFQGQVLIMQTYCPEEVEAFQSFVDDLETDEVAGD